MVGASGAIAGVLGAYLVLFPTARIRTLIFLGIFITVLQLPALVVIGFFIVIQFIEGFASLRLSGHAATENVAYFAHIFGFFAGIGLLLLLGGQTRHKSPPYGRYGQHFPVPASPSPSPPVPHPYITFHHPHHTTTHTPTIPHNTPHPS